MNPAVVSSNVLFVLSEMLWVGLSSCFFPESLTKMMFLKRFLQIVTFQIIHKEGEVTSLPLKWVSAYPCYSIRYECRGCMNKFFLC